MIKLVLLLLLFSCQKMKVHPEKGQIVEAVYGLGIVKSENDYYARSAIISTVVEFYVTEGQDVVKGQKLFLTNERQVQTAPFSGRITDIPVTVSETVFPQTIILNLVDLGNLYLEVSLEQQTAMKLSKGMPAEVSFEFFRNKKLEGVISTIYPKNDQFIAKVLIKDWPQGVLPGMSADVAFEIARKKDATLIPTKAIANGHILIRRNDKKEKIAIQIGLSDQEKTEVVSPALSLTDEIIIP